MPAKNAGTESRRQPAKRMLSPSQKYEIWLQLVRQESTVAEVAWAQQDRPVDDDADQAGRQGGRARVGGVQVWGEAARLLHPGLSASSPTHSGVAARRCPGHP